MRRVIVLGTGTNVGKTHVSVRLAHALARSGPVQALKPIESGRSDGRFLDATSLGRCSHLVAAESEPLFGFEEPVSPHLAARREGRIVSVPAIVDWVAERSAGDGWCIVETAGGLLTPLAPMVTNFDLARALDPAVWLLVAPDALGVISGLSTSVVAMRALGRAADLCVLSEASPADASTGSNADELERLGITAVTAVFGRNGGEGAAADRLATAILAYERT